MKRRINIKQTVVYNHSIDLEVDCSEGTLNKILDIAEKEECLEDVSQVLKAQGVKIIDWCEDDSGDSKVEIDDIEEI